MLLTFLLVLFLVLSLKKCEGMNESTYKAMYLSCCSSFLLFCHCCWRCIIIVLVGGCVLVVGGCVLVVGGCVLVVGGCVLVVGGCVLVVGGCVLVVVATFMF